MKKIILSTVALSVLAATATTANAEDISVSISADYVSEYVFRGVSFANTAIQPGIEVSKGGFTVGTWVSAALGETSDLASDEIDVYAGYGWDINDAVSASVGATIYHFPEAGGLFDIDASGGSTLEVYAGLGFNTVLSPAITAYYDVNFEAFTLEGSVGHSVPVADKTSLDLGLTAGLVDVDDASYEWATGSAAVSYAITDAASFYVGANLSLNSEDNLDFVTFGDLEGLTLDEIANLSTTSDDTLFWVGTGISTSF
ncbi:MAG: TorF family putative porin [Maricaulaceae bacterium]